MSWVSRIFHNFSREAREAIGAADPIGREVERLRRLDPGCSVFGASTHRYRLRRPSSAEVDALESWCGRPLPAPYRHHLCVTGSGAGPYYGLLSPTDSRGHLGSFAQEYHVEAGEIISPSRPFPFTTAQAKDLSKRRRDGEENVWLAATWPLNGCIPICQHGCSLWTVLVVTGECVGRVWDVHNVAGNEGWWFPSQRPPGRLCLWERNKVPALPEMDALPNFEEWYVSWIERATADLHQP